jgi:2-amino-4-hydroxy-6-hydroxymethyldihydropteridine diphosphokinase
MTRAYLGLGSNLGDRLENLKRAVALLEERGISLLRSSRVYETEPVGGPPQPDYLNAVIQVEGGRSPRKLLEASLTVEEEMGRERNPGERFGPRVIDIDILTFGRREINEPDLTVPHPRMHERWFVLVPLTELVADPPLPGGRKVKGLRLASDGIAAVRPFAAPLR